MSKHTIEHLQEIFSQYGFELLSSEYINAHAKLTYKDVEGYYFYQSYNGFDKNKSSLLFSISNPYTVQNIKLWCKINNKLFELLSTEFVGNNKNLKWQCFKCGEIFEAKWGNISQDKGCGKCAKNRKLTYNEVQEFVEIESGSGCKLLSTKYQDCYKKLSLKCECGNHFLVNFSDFKNSDKRQCNECGFIRIGNARRHDFEYIKQFIESNSECKLISKDYKDNTTKLLIQCKCGEKFYDTFAHFSEENCSRACEVCSNKIKWDIEKMQAWCNINADGYIVLEIIKKDIKFNNLYVKIICPIGEHKPYITSWNNFYSKNKRCKKCFHDNHMAENHPNWKGGITQIYHYLRHCLSQWKTDSMNNCNYKCVLTGNAFTHIHHLQGFSSIVTETFEELKLQVFPTISEYTEKQLTMIRNKFTDIHYKYPLGICLRKDIHNLFHGLYGKTNNTPKQFEEFTRRYNDGEFNLLNKIKEVS